jgi:hypothetical protein
MWIWIIKFIHDGKFNSDWYLKLAPEVRLKGNSGNGFMLLWIVPISKRFYLSF